MLQVGKNYIFVRMGESARTKRLHVDETPYIVLDEETKDKIPLHTPLGLYHHSHDSDTVVFRKPSVTVSGETCRVAYYVVGLIGYSQGNVWAVFDNAPDAVRFAKERNKILVYYFGDGTHFQVHRHTRILARADKLDCGVWAWMVFGVQRIGYSAKEDVKYDIFHTLWGI